MDSLKERWAETAYYCCAGLAERGGLRSAMEHSPVLHSSQGQAMEPSTAENEVWHWLQVALVGEDSALLVAATAGFYCCREVFCQFEQMLLQLRHWM